MTGLDKIIEEIKSDANSAAEKKINDAKEQAKAIISDAEKKAEEKANEIKNKTAFDIDVIKSRGDASLELEKRKSVLKAKQEIIQHMINSALDKLRSLPEKEYFDLLLKMINKHSSAEKGELILSQKDLSRAPSDFSLLVSNASNGNLTLSSQTREIDAGFILVYGGIEENCTFEAMFAAADEEIKDHIAKMLFN